ncbi:MAG: hypothetical protein U0793_31245 [Gemmataceae bacterium]
MKQRISALLDRIRAAYATMEDPRKAKMLENAYLELGDISEGGAEKVGTEALEKLLAVTESLLDFGLLAPLGAYRPKTSNGVPGANGNGHFKREMQFRSKAEREQFLASARKKTSAEEIAAGLHEIEATGGLQFCEFVEELDEAARPK